MRAAGSMQDYLQQCRTTFTYTRKIGFGVFSGCWLVTYWMVSESPPRAHKRYRKSYESRRENALTHNDSRHTGRRSCHAWRHNWNSHSAFVGQSERARAAPNDLFNHVEKFQDVWNTFRVTSQGARANVRVGTDWHVNCESRIREWHSSTQSDAQNFFLSESICTAAANLWGNDWILMWKKISTYFD